MAKSKNPKKKIKEKMSQTKKNTPNNNTSSHQQQPTNKPHSWAIVRTLFTCKHTDHHLAEEMKKQQIKKDQNLKMKYCSAGSICNNTKVMQRPNDHHQSVVSNEDLKKRGSNSRNKNHNSNDPSRKPMKISLKELNGVGALSKSSSSCSMSVASSSSPSFTGSFKAMPFRKLSGCYECKMVVDPVLGFGRDPFLRGTICSCPICGEVFMKVEYLELHQATKHAVSELGADDTSKNIVEIIFQSSWLKKENPICIIDRILKIQNTPKTISRFEEYRDTIKSKATKLPKKHPRCIADGNELLRFHCTTFTCSLGLNGSSNLCNSIPRCNVCSIIKSGFKFNGETVNPRGVTGELGILTTATSGRAHDKGKVGTKDDHKRAMLVCRVIAGRVKKNLEGNVEEDYDSIGGNCEVYSNLDELYVFNPRAILPCFVVIYRAV